MSIVHYFTFRKIGSDYRTKKVKFQGKSEIFIKVDEESII